MNKKPAFYQHLRAPNSPSGNPQRLYMVYDAAGEVVRVIDEGYRGLPRELRDVRQLMTIEIPRAEYHSIRRNYRAQES